MRLTNKWPASVRLLRRLAAYQRNQALDQQGTTLSPAVLEDWANQMECGEWPRELEEVSDGSN